MIGDICWIESDADLYISVSVALGSNLTTFFSFIFSFFLHSICLNGSGYGEQIFSIGLYVRKPYPAAHETG